MNLDHPSSEAADREANLYYRAIGVALASFLVGALFGAWLLLEIISKGSP